MTIDDVEEKLGFHWAWWAIRPPPAGMDLIRYYYARMVKQA